MVRIVQSLSVPSDDYHMTLLSLFKAGGLDIPVVVPFININLLETR